MATITTQLLGWLHARTTRRATRAGTPEVAAVPLASGERVLADTRDAHGAPVVATDRAVYHQNPPSPPGAWARLGWEQVADVRWDAQRQGLVLTGWTPDVPQRTVLAVPRGDPLAALARERVAWTRLIVTRVRVGQHGQARVAVRREPGTDRLVWMVALDDGVPDGPAVRAEVAEALARLRAELGS